MAKEEKVEQSETEMVEEEELDSLTIVSKNIHEMLVESELTYNQSLRVLRAISEMLESRALDERVKEIK